MKFASLLLLSFTLLASLPALAHGDTLLKVLDRTNEPRPLVIDADTDMSDTLLIDDNGTRPAVLLLSGTFKLGGARRSPNGVQERDNDPGLGSIFDGTFQPRLKITFSHHDFDRAFVAAMGTFKFECGTMTADTCVSVTASPDGSYGHGSTIKLGTISGYRFGILASGQQDLDVSITEATSASWNNGEGPGHTFYGNESRLTATSEYLRLKGVKIRIGKSRSVAMATGVRGDHVTTKFKGSWGVDYECLDDKNACGAFDQYGSSGIARVKWVHPGGDAMNGNFAAFRCGGEATFGPPAGKFIVSGFFDCTRAPDQTVTSYRWETKMAAFAEATLIGGGAATVWQGTDITGLNSGLKLGFNLGIAF